jgi:hypothetical protein
VIRVDAVWMAVEPLDMRAGAERLLAPHRGPRRVRASRAAPRSATFAPPPTWLPLLAAAAAL